MTKQLFEVKQLNELPKVAKALIELLKQAPVMAFYGEMGAGKTTLINEMCRQLDIINQASSPTFSLVNEYSNSNGLTVYHFDFYRINRLEEAYDIGYENYFYSGYPCLIEWPEKIEQLLPETFVKVLIVDTGTLPEGRKIEAETRHR